MNITRRSEASAGLSSGAGAGRRPHSRGMGCTGFGHWTEGVGDSVDSVATTALAGDNRGGHVGLVGVGMSAVHLNAAVVVAALRAVQSDAVLVNIRKRLASGEEALGMRMRDLFAVARRLPRLPRSDHDLGHG